MLRVEYPIDEGPDRGLSVFAVKALKRFDVVCLYAGALQSSEEGLQKSIRKQGAKNVLEYLFGTGSQKRVVDAYKTGGVASLVNTGKYKDLPAFKENKLRSSDVW